MPHLCTLIPKLQLAPTITARGITRPFWSNLNPYLLADAWTGVTVSPQRIYQRFVMSKRNEKSTSEEPQADKKPVLFQVPENWDDLSDEEQEEIADQIIDAMG